MDIRHHLNTLKKDIAIANERRVDSAVTDALEQIHKVLIELDNRTRE